VGHKRSHADDHATQTKRTRVEPVVLEEPTEVYCGGDSLDNTNIESTSNLGPPTSTTMGFPSIGAEWTQLFEDHRPHNKAWSISESSEDMSLEEVYTETDIVLRSKTS
jgi:hypothetical protein